MAGLESGDSPIQGNQGSRVSLWDALIIVLDRLHGNSYLPIKKSILYTIVGNIIKKNIIKCGKYIIDPRLNMFYPLKSRHGKKILTTTIRKALTSLGKIYSEPTSFHAEQLIGKIILDIIKLDDGTKKEVKIPNYGYLKNDFIIFDDAKKYLMDEKYDEARRYIRLALDTIGDNEVTKKLVDDFPSDTLKYCPECSIVFLFQPFIFPEDLVTEGLLARGIIIYIDVPDRERYEIIYENMEEGIDEDTAWKTISYNLKQIEDKTFNWKFSKTVLIEIAKKTEEIVKSGRNNSYKTKNYITIMLPEIQKNIIRMACIQSALDGRSEVTNSDVNIAFNDYQIFWNLQLNFIIEKVSGNFDYSDNIPFKLKNGLRFLFVEGATSQKESNVTINDYIKQLASETGKSKSSAQKDYSKQRRAGLVDSKQMGQYDSRIWLTEIGSALCDPETLGTLKPGKHDLNPSNLEELN